MIQDVSNVKRQPSGQLINQVTTDQNGKYGKNSERNY
jgi:hypothetical protein